jgi:hypothetical protein
VKRVTLRELKKQVLIIAVVEDLKKQNQKLTARMQQNQVERTLKLLKKTIGTCGQPTPETKNK